MDLEYIGKHCHHCRQKDFLPLQCSKCSHWFCSEHATPSGHSCPSRQQPQAGYSVDRPHSGLTTAPTKRCSHDRCNSSALAQCNRCSRSHCAQHRYPDTHRCSSTQSQSQSQQHTNSWLRKLHLMKERRTRVQRTSSETLIRSEAAVLVPRNRSGNAAMRRRSAPMEVLSFGNTLDTLAAPNYNPNLEREDAVQVDIIYPLESQCQPLHCIVSKRHTVGKLVDLIAEQARVSNRNATLPRTSSERLQLYHLGTSRPLPLGVTMDQLVKEGMVREGDVIMLERGPDGELIAPHVALQLFELSSRDLRITCRQTFQYAMEQLGDNDTIASAVAS